MKCLLLDIEMPVGKVCPVPYNLDGFLCYEGCGCADNPELINEKIENWEKLKVEMNLNAENSEKK